MDLLLHHSYFPGIFAFFITYVLCKIAEGRYLLAYPNHRSAHTKPTSTFGGIAMFVGMLSGMGVLFLFHPDVFNQDVIKVLGCSSIIWLFSLIDDIRPMGAFTRLGLQGLFALSVVFILDIQIGLPEPFQFLNIPITLLFICGFINASNFSDGINGLWSGTVLVWTMFMIATSGNDPMLNIFMGTVLGYFLLNFPKGRIFMGDSGSTFLGGFILCYSLFVFNSPITKYMSIVMIFSPFAFVFADVFVTLSKRIFQGHHPFDAHKEHYMQRLVHILGLSHGLTTMIYLVGALLSTFSFLRFGLKDIWGLIFYLTLQSLYFMVVEYLCWRKSTSQA